MHLVELSKKPLPSQHPKFILVNFAFLLKNTVSIKLFSICCMFSTSSIKIPLPEMLPQEAPI